MSEKRFVIDEEGISDNKTDKWYCWKEEVVDLLNEQQSIIHRDEISIKTMMSNMEKLEEENEQLRKELDSFHPVMFQDMRYGTVTLYSKGGIDE